MPDLHTTSITNPADSLTQLGDLIRMRIIRVLARQELSVGELIRVIQIPQSSGSRHLKLLSEGGWVIKRSVGPATYYRVVLDDLPSTMRALWLAIRDDLDSNTDAQGDDQRIRSVLSERVTDSNAFFGEHAGQWDGLRTDLFGRYFTDRALLGFINPSWRIADLGCGTGNCTELLSPWVKEVIAVDQSPEMLAGARARLENAQVPVDHVQFVQGELGKLPLNDESVDAAVCMLVIHHIDSPAEAIHEMRRVLSTERGGGVAVLVDMCEHTNQEYRRSMGHKHLGFSNAEIIDLFTSAGFEDIRVNTLRPDVDSSGPPLFVAVARIQN
ncbi:MAG: ArsR/SmtB family transcription factor [Phycisphaerales bacterium]